MFFVIIPISCLLAIVLAKDAIKAKELCIDDENTEEL